MRASGKPRIYCLDCGPVKNRDPATQKRCGKTVRNGPNKGGPCPNFIQQWDKGCWKHVKTKQARRAAVARREDAQVLALVARENIEPTANPYEALAHQLGQLLRKQEIFEERLGELEEWNTGSPLFQAWQWAVDRNNRLLVDVAKLGIDDKRILMSSFQAQRAATKWQDATRELLTRLRNGENLDTLEAALPDIARRHLLGA